MLSPNQHTTSTPKKTWPILASCFCIYILFTWIFSGYAFYSANFQPSASTIRIAFYASGVYFILLIFSFWKAMKFNEAAISIGPIKKWIIRLFVWPAFVVMNAGLHFYAASIGLPSALSKLLVDKSEALVDVVDKHQKKRKRTHVHYVTISGPGIEYELTAPSSFFNEIEVGKKILIGVRATALGVDFEL